MIKIYGMPSCPYCAFLEPQIKDNPEFVYLDIGKDVRIMHEFLALRDSHPAFEPYKKIGDIGIPCFVKEDGTVTLEPSEVGLISLSEGASCKADGSGC